MSMPTMISCANNSLSSMCIKITHTCNPMCSWPIINHKTSYSNIINILYGDHQAVYPRELQAENCVIVGSFLYSNKDIQCKILMEFLAHLSGYNMTARWKAFNTRPEEGKEFLRMWHVETDEKDKNQVIRFLESMYNTPEKTVSFGIQTPLSLRCERLYCDPWNL
jgi:hypothetical protein